MLQMCFMAVGVNSEVIKVYENKLVFQSHKIYVHGSLKEGPSIHYPK